MKLDKEYFTVSHLLTNPVGIGIVAGAGMIYGIYRLSAGEEADIWINEKFGFR